MGLYTLIAGIAFALVGCSISVEGEGAGSGQSGGPSGSGTVGTSSIDWSRVPISMNPQVVESRLQLNGIRRLKVSPSLLREPSVLLKFNPSLPSNVGVIRSYWLGPGLPFGETSTRVQDELSWANLPPANTRCELQISNRIPTSVLGICHIRMEVELPLNSLVEVYSNGTLIGPRRFAIEYGDFLSMYLRAGSDSDRLELAREFVASHRATQTSLAINASSQLRPLLRGMSFRDGRLSLLELLHPFVADRFELRDVLDRELGGSERLSALSITGV